MDRRRSRHDENRRSSRAHSGYEWTLIGLEIFTGLTALVGGLLLVIRPDGSLLMADPSVLAATPFSDWLIPGILLATLVGLGFLLAAFWQWAHGVFARYVSLVAGVGLVAFEVTQFLMIGFQPLQAVMAVIGVVVAVLAARAGPITTIRAE